MDFVGHIPQPRLIRPQITRWTGESIARLVVCIGIALALILATLTTEVALVAAVGVVAVFLGQMELRRRDMELTHAEASQPQPFDRFLELLSLNLPEILRAANPQARTEEVEPQLLTCARCNQPLTLDELTGGHGPIRHEDPRTCLTFTEAKAKSIRAEIEGGLAS